MVIALPIIPHGSAAGDLLDHFQRNVLFPILNGSCRHRKIKTAQRLAQVAACALGKVGTGILVHADLCALPFRKLFQCIVHPTLHIRRRKRFELKHRAAGQQRIINVEVWIFGGGCNERHRAVLNAFQQALLLFFVQVLDLVQIQQDASRTCQRADILEHRLDVPGAAGSAIELMQRHTAVFCNDACHRRFSGTGRAVEDHVRDASALDGTAEHPARCQQMLLTADICQCFGPQTLCQWFVHRVFLLPYRGAIPPAFFYSISHFGSKSKVLSENHSQIIFARSLQKTQNMVLSYQLLLMGVDEMPVRKKAPEDLTAKKALALEVIDRLKKEYPDAGCTLDYDHAWQLLVSVRLAAQCTDARVNIVVEDLFARYPNVAALAAAEPEDIEAIVKPCGLGHSKARDISACMRVLRDKYGCQVPTTFEELLALPGVGRKSANLIMGDVFGKPAIVTDTHCIRLCNKIGLVDGIKEPQKVEMALWKIVPPEEGSDLCHRFVMHGRAVCNARKPECEKCCLKDICRFARETAGQSAEL